MGAGGGGGGGGKRPRSSRFRMQKVCKAKKRKLIQFSEGNEKTNESNKVIYAFTRFILCSSCKQYVLYTVVEGSKGPAPLLCKNEKCQKY